MTLKHRHVHTLICGAVSVILACLVIFGWHSGNQSLVQVNAAFAPMQYNTALGFLLCGLALITLSIKLYNASRALGIAAGILGATTLIQYIFNIDFGIDEFLMDPVFITKTSHPGRMAPNTALCFTLCGIALSATRQDRALIISAALAVLILASLSLAGYLMHHEDLYGWGSLTRMAIHTASGFMIIVTGLITSGAWIKQKKKFDLWAILPFSISIIVAVLTLFSSYTIDEVARQRNAAHLQKLISDTQDALLNRYSLYEQTLRSGVGLFYASQYVSREEWRNYSEAFELEKTLPGINGIGYIDYVLSHNLDEYIAANQSHTFPDFKNHPDTFYPDKFIINYIEPIEHNKEAVGLDIGFEANRRAAAERARDLGVPALTKKIILVQDHKKQAGFLLLLPVYDTKSTPSNIAERRAHFKGWVYAPFIGANFFKDIDQVNKNQLYLEVFDGKKTSPESLIYVDPEYSHDTHHTKNKSNNVSLTKMKISGRIWTLAWRQNEHYMPPASQNLGTALLIFGLTFSAFLYYTLGRLLRSKELIHQKVEEQTAELKQASEFQDLITNTIPDFLFVKDENFKIVDANDAFLSLYPKDIRHSVIGSTTIENYTEEEADTFLEHDKIAFDSGYSEVEETLTFPNGESRIVLTKKVLFENTSGEPFILGISRDITESKQAQEKIIHANAELKRSNHELERFAYIASHDLQEPLRKIGGFTGRLEKHFAHHLEGDEKAQTYMGFITGGVDRMRELIMGLLAYSRVTTSEIETQELDTNNIVNIAIDNLSETIAENEARIHYQDLPTLYYDKVMLTQLFQNLIGNAIKYRSETTPDITISCQKNQAFWEFCISDNGMGMEDKYLDRIFEMFQRLHRKEDISGTGIGLSLCQKIVERYGGTIWATSIPDTGSKFYFTIPIKED